MAEMYDMIGGKYITMRDITDPHGTRARALAQRVKDESGGNVGLSSSPSGPGSSYATGTAVAKKVANITGVIS